LLALLIYNIGLWCIFYRRRISTGKIRPWNNDLVVDWAEQQEEPDDEVMSQVKVLYIRNLKEAVTEEKLRELFGAHGEIEKAKRIKDYAFIHFVERSAALSVIYFKLKTFGEITYF
jgi:predicted type IV restriction endonuclease